MIFGRDVGCSRALSGRKHKKYIRHSVPQKGKVSIYCFDFFIIKIRMRSLVLVLTFRGVFSLKIFSFEFSSGGLFKIFILDPRFLDPNGRKLAWPTVYSKRQIFAKNYPFKRYSFLGLLRSHSGF